MKTSEPIVFFGSGPVAAKSLTLLAELFTIEAVITKPRPPHHRGPVPVLEVCEKLGLSVVTVEDRQSLDKALDSRKFKSRLGILIDFGIIVSQHAIDSFSLGIVNSHFSLLPEWRGADPITFSILSGQAETGVSLMMLVPAMDEGPILAYAKQPITSETTTPELTQELILLSAGMIESIIPDYLAGNVSAAPQGTSITPTYSRKLTKSDGVIDWSKPAINIERDIRAFIEWPKSHALIGTTPIIITKAHVVDLSGQAGTFSTYGKELMAFCGTQALIIERLKPAGKQEMTGKSFLAGHREKLGNTLLGS